MLRFGKTLFILSLAATIFLFTRASVLDAQSPSPSTSTLSRPECIGQALTDYLNTVTSEISKAGGLGKVKMLSPAFNLTNPEEVAIFNAMKADGANFSALAGYAGNTYTAAGDTAYGHYSSKWKSLFNGKPVFFTEFGDFATEGTTIDARPEIIQRMKTEYNTAASDGTIYSINYFNAFGTNPDSDFAKHILSDTELRSITSSNTSKGGVNSGSVLDSSGGFTQHVSADGLRWNVQIITAPDVNQAADTINQARSQGVQTILRLCVGDSCGFSDSATLVSFLQGLDRNISGTAYVIIGPNEPATEIWAAPQCGKAETSQISTWQPQKVPCSDTISPEFHSLRPYPASPCNDEPSKTVLLCGNDLVVKETYDVTPGEAVPGSCHQKEGSPAGTTECDFRVSSTVNVSLDLNNAKLPILGNTENVPNAQNQEEGFGFRERVNNYVSWYLNGVISRAEEKLFGVPDGLNEIVNLSGPIKKLLPQSIQTGIRRLQNDNIGSERHNQIYACTENGVPQACYTKPLTEERIAEGAELPENDVRFSYVPFSTTEDRVGLAEIALPDITAQDSHIKEIKFQPKDDISRESLFFAHTEEADKLGEILQKTYSPGGDTNLIGNPSNEGVDAINYTPYCEVLDTRTNPGDKLYANLNDNGPDSLGGTLSYTAEFPCTFSPPKTNDACIADCNGDATCEETCTESPKCQNQTQMKLSISTRTPFANDLWGRFVAGSMSVFKRIFPMVGPGTPVEEIKDIPGSTQVTYKSSSGGSSLPSSGTQTIAGDPGAGRPGTNAQLFFPHLGSIEDYFLKGIQLALRPQGYGETTLGAQTGGSTGQLIMAGQCNPVTDASSPCTVSSLLPYFNNDQAKATYASEICLIESGGYPFSKNTNCLTGKTYDYSIGLFQVNLLAHSVTDPDTGQVLDCPSAFSQKNFSTRSCTVDPAKQGLLDRCVSILENPSENIKKMVQISSGGTNWNPWLNSKNRCSLP